MSGIGESGRSRQANYSLRDGPRLDYSQYTRQLRGPHNPEIDLVVEQESEEAGTELVAALTELTKLQQEQQRRLVETQRQQEERRREEEELRRQQQEQYREQLRTMHEQHLQQMEATKGVLKEQFALEDSTISREGGYLGFLRGL